MTAFALVVSFVGFVLVDRLRGEREGTEWTLVALQVALGVAVLATGIAVAFG